MHFYLLLATLTLVNAGVVTDTKCDGVIFDGHYHEKEIFKTGLDRPFHLAFDYNTNIIYFSYHSNETDFKSALFDLNVKEFKDINDVRQGEAQAVDQNTHDVYIGGLDGIFKYDHKNHTSELYAATDVSIRYLFIKDILYFSDFPFLKTYIDGNKAILKGFECVEIGDYVIDGEDVIFYETEFGFYGHKKGERSVLYSHEKVNALTVDVYGNAYMCSPHAIYKINKVGKGLDKLMDVNDCYGLAFDAYNNMIYSDLNSLVRLIKIPKIC